MLVYAALCHQVKTLALESRSRQPLPLMATFPELPQNFETALAELVAFCQTALKDAQQQIEILEKGVLRTFAPDGGDDAP